MKRFIVHTLFALACLLTTAPGASAFISTGDGAWIWQNPLPQGNRLLDVDFVDASHGWTVGDDGVILATSDGGTTWQTQVSGTQGALRAVAFADTLHGWAAEYPAIMGGTEPVMVYATADGGATWTEQPSAAGMEDFACLDAQHVWAAGGHRILATGDGGAMWSERWSDPLVDLNGIFFLDQTHGWAVGGSASAPGTPGPAVILTTTDGGLTWTKQQTGLMYRSFDDVVFADTVHGWVVSQQAGLYSTTDGGATWTKQPLGDTVGFCAVACTDASHVWAVTGQSQWVQSADGGATWQWRDFSHRRGILGVSFGDTAHGCMVCDAGIIDVTADGGGAWQRATSGFLYDLHGVSFADVSHGIAVGESGCVYTTKDGGTTWIKQQSGTTSSLSKVFCLNASRAWAVGDYEVILMTGDGGASWTLQHSMPDDYLLNDVTFVDASHGWAVGNRGVLATSDGGAHWGKLSMPGVGTVWWDVCFVDATHGWVEGLGSNDHSRILATKDGGASWVVQFDKLNAPAGSISFIDRLRGWSGAYKTKDGGATWTRVKNAPTGGDLTFLDALHGWQVYGGGIGTTSDGGAHWTYRLTGALGLAGNACFLDAHHAWLVGHDGAILATKTGGFPPVTTTASGAVGGRWYRGPVTVTLKVTDNTGGVGVAYTEHKVDGGPWVKGRSFTVSGEGRHVVRYRSADNDLNLEYDHRLAFGIDTVRPTTKAPAAEGVTSGHQMALKWQVVDPAPNAGWATVTIKIKNGAGVVVKTLGPYKNQTVNVVHNPLVTCTLPRGLYRFYVYAKDAAGNAQKLPVASNRLRVY